MNVRYLASMAATLVASMCVAAEPSPDKAQVRRPYVHSALVASAQRRRSASFSASEPTAPWQQKPGARLDMMAYSDGRTVPPQLRRQEKPTAPPENKETLGDPFAEPSPEEARPSALPPETPAQTPPEAEREMVPPSAPPPDVFETPPENAPSTAPARRHRGRSCPTTSLNRPAEAKFPSDLRHAVRHRAARPSRRLNWCLLPSRSPSQTTARGVSTASACPTVTTSSSTIACPACSRAAAICGTAIVLPRCTCVSHLVRGSTWII